LTGLTAGGFLGLTALRAEGCGGRCAAIYSPLPLEGGCRRRRRRIADFRRKSEALKGPNLIHKYKVHYSGLSSGLRPAPYVRATKGKRPYGQARRLTSPELGNPMQNCHREEGACVTCFPSRPHRHILTLGEESWYSKHMRQSVVNTSRR
jgi:hypothetical protein